MKRAGTKVPLVPEYPTKELSKKTWRDFEQLFATHPAPGAYPCWCMHNHRCGPLAQAGQRDSSIKRTMRNHQDQRALVENGRSHGILVYAQGEPVGWCQYGSGEELPRIDNNAGYRKLTPKAGTSRLWRITCFVTHRKYRGRGIARTALKAALAAIRKRGGGAVEAYPIRRWGAYGEYRGTVSMFKKEGLEIVAPLGASNVVMRKAI